MRYFTKLSAVVFLLGTLLVSCSKPDTVEEVKSLYELSSTDKGTGEDPPEN